MVGAVDLRIDRGGFKPRDKGVRNAEIVDTPTDIPLSCLCPVRPPGVGLCSIGVQVAKGIGKA